MIQRDEYMRGPLGAIPFTVVNETVRAEQVIASAEEKQWAHDRVEALTVEQASIQWHRMLGAQVMAFCRSHHVALRWMFGLVYVIWMIRYGLGYVAAWW